MTLYHSKFFVINIYYFKFILLSIMNKDLQLIHLFVNLFLSFAIDLFMYEPSKIYYWIKFLIYHLRKSEITSLIYTFLVKPCK